MNQMHESDFNFKTHRIERVIPYDARDAGRCDDLCHGKSSSVLTSMTLASSDVDDVVSWRESVSETHGVLLPCYEQCRLTSHVKLTEMSQALHLSQLPRRVAAFPQNAQNVNIIVSFTFVTRYSENIISYNEFTFSLRFQFRPIARGGDRFRCTYVLLNC